MTTRLSSVDETAPGFDMSEEIKEPEMEMSEAIDEVVAVLARRLRGTALIAWTLFAMAMVGIVPAWLTGPKGLFMLPMVVGGYLMFVALRTQRAAFEFEQIARTTGSDQGHLLSALKQLVELYRLKIYLVMILFAAGLLLAFAGSAG